MGKDSFLCLVLAALLTTGGMSAHVFGQDPPPATPPPTTPPATPPATPPEKQAEKEAGKETSEADTSSDDQETEDARKQEQAEQTDKQAASPPESGDDITSHLEETTDTDTEDQEDKTPPPEEVVSPIKEVVKEEEQESGDNVAGSLQESREIRVGLFPHGPVAELYRLWKPLRDELYADTGIDVGMAYTTLYQVATDGFDEPREGWSGDVDFFGKWILLNRDKPNTGSTGFLVEQRHRFGNITPNALNDNLGGLWRTTKGFNIQNWALAQAWWEQYLFEDHVKVVAGKIDASNYYNGNRFQSQNTFFLNQAFSTNPTRAFPDNGLGVNVRLAPSDGMYFSFGAHDTNNSKTTSGFNNLDKDELFYAFELGLTPRFEGRGPGRYRFTGWYTGAGERTLGESGKGFALSFDQDMGNSLVPFFRYGYQDDAVNATKQIVVGGLGVLKPFGLEHDILGIGFAWGQPGNSDFRDQYVTEVFLRHQLTPKIQFTPGFQVIFDPSLNPDDDVIGVFELRWRVVF